MEIRKTIVWTASWDKNLPFWVNSHKLFWYKGKRAWMWDSSMGWGFATIEKAIEFAGTNCLVVDPSIIV